MSNISPSTRKQCDFTKLIIAGYEIELPEGNTQDFLVTFHGPKETLYEEGVWKVHVTLPDDYPFSSPSIGFTNKILHPNIDEVSGSVCLDVINQTWTPIYSLVNIFDIFLPQLLRDPNPDDPLNSDAGNLMMRNRLEYEKKVRDYVRIHAYNNLLIKNQEKLDMESKTALLYKTPSPSVLKEHHPGQSSSYPVNITNNNSSSSSSSSSSSNYRNPSVTPMSDLSFTEAVVDENDDLSDL